MTSSPTEKLSRVLSLVLRHAPEAIGVSLDRAGWVVVDELLTRLNHRTPATPKRLRTLGEVTAELLMQAVREDAKGRYELSPDFKRIRAAQGHSIPVELGYPTVTPPEVLYHGTHADALPAIRVEGLLPGARHAVHLSGNSATARSVGARRGHPIILTVLAALMSREGYKFSQASNGVWLTARVPAKYLRENPR
jgi:putative RNA 2'-phosphotransferase